MQKRKNCFYSFALLLLIILVTTHTSFADQIDTNKTEEQNPETGQPIVDQNTQKEMVAMVNGIGAKVRLLQLEKSILRAILRGGAVINYIEKNYPEEDTNNLKEIIAEMRVLKDEVAEKAKGIQNTDENIVKTFVDLKNDAISLTKQFRDEARNILKDKNKSGLADEFKNIDWTEYKELHNEIVSLIREYNAKKIEEALDKIPEKAKELSQKLKKGEISAEEAAKELRETIRGLGSEQRKNIVFGLGQAASKARVLQQQWAIAAKRRFMERRIERLEGRLERLRNRYADMNIDMNRLRTRIQERIANPKIPTMKRGSPSGKQNGYGGASK
ncbi:MAG: hypothetical protein N3F05_02945 [Candidatus Diapherotrites archaeon]|nr:hypothetical protein [Candidatus Diapherotrites archaeon]